MRVQWSEWKEAHVCLEGLRQLQSTQAFSTSGFHNVEYGGGGGCQEDVTIFVLGKVSNFVLYVKIVSHAITGHVFTYFNALCSGACSNLHHQLVFCKAWMDQQACLKDVISWHVDSFCFMHFSMCHFPTLHQSRVCYLNWHGSEPITTNLCAYCQFLVQLQWASP